MMIMLVLWTYMQLGQFDSKQDDDARVTYAVRLYEVYPQTIGSY